MNGWIYLKKVYEDKNLITVIGFEFREFAVGVARKIGIDCYGGATINNKRVIDLSPKILRVVSVTSIILIICNIAMDIIFTESIDYSNITSLIILYIFCVYFREKENKKSNIS